jgi:hypothetical protein
VGRAVGRMVQSALGAVGEQIRQAAEQAADVQSRAVVSGLHCAETAVELRDILMKHNHEDMCRGVGGE